MKLYFERVASVFRFSGHDGVLNYNEINMRLGRRAQLYFSGSHFYSSKTEYRGRTEEYLHIGGGQCDMAYRNIYNGDTISDNMRQIVESHIAEAVKQYEYIKRNSANMLVLSPGKANREPFSLTCPACGKGLLFLTDNDAGCLMVTRVCCSDESCGYGYRVGAQE